MSEMRNFDVDNFLLSIEGEDQSIRPNHTHLLQTIPEERSLNETSAYYSLDSFTNQNLLSQQEYLQKFKANRTSSKTKYRLYQDVMKVLSPENACLIQKRYQRKFFKESRYRKIRHFNLRKKVYKKHQNGRKNFTKNVGSLLRRYFMSQSAHPQIASNFTIQKFINFQSNKQVNYSIRSLKQLRQDDIAKQLASRYFAGQEPLIELMRSSISDRKWYILQLRMLTNIINTQ